MSRSQATILTNMCLIEDGRGNIVMQIRDPKRYSWSGAALPGGHIEAHEGLVESVIREVKEETGLTIKSPPILSICISQIGAFIWCILMAAPLYHLYVYYKRSPLSFIVSSELMFCNIEFVI